MSCLSNWIVRAIACALKWLFPLLTTKLLEYFFCFYLELKRIKISQMFVVVI